MGVLIMFVRRNAEKYRANAVLIASWFDIILFASEFSSAVLIVSKGNFQWKLVLRNERL